MSELLAEVIGTMILVTLGCSVVAGVLLKDSKSEGSGWMVITAGWGFAVAMAVYAVGHISGAHINPAVTLALAIIGEFPWEKVGPYIIAQFIGAIAGASITFLHYLPHWKKTNDPELKLAVFSNSPAIPNVPANLLSEVIGTFILVLCILSIGANEFAQGINPLIIGFLVFSIGLSLGGPTGYAINPARDLGPRIAHFLLPIPDKGSSNWKYSWIPVLGPFMGGVYGAVFYKALFIGTIDSVFIGLSISIIALIIWAVISVKQNQIE